MRLSYLWLNELVEGLPDAEEVGRRLTMGGIEVEAITRPSVDYGDRLAVAIIQQMQPHPNADRRANPERQDFTTQALTPLTRDKGKGHG